MAKGVKGRRKKVLSIGISAIILVLLIASGLYYFHIFPFAVESQKSSLTAASKVDYTFDPYATPTDPAGDVAKLKANPPSTHASNSDKAIYWHQLITLSADVSQQAVVDAYESAIAAHVTDFSTNELTLVATGYAKTSQKDKAIDMFNKVEASIQSSDPDLRQVQLDGLNNTKQELGL